MTGIDRLLETFLVVQDVDAACGFYRDVLQLEPYGKAGARGCLFRLPGGQLLGLVDRNAAREPNVVAGGAVPSVLPTTTSSRPGAHLCFAISEEDLSAWRRRLDELGVGVLSVVEWERGGRSLYFRDADGHLLELATPGLWDFY